jgi:hypothetical protein
MLQNYVNLSINTELKLAFKSPILTGHFRNTSNRVAAQASFPENLKVLIDNTVEGVDTWSNR